MFILKILSKTSTCIISRGVMVPEFMKWNSRNSPPQRTITHFTKMNMLVDMTNNRWQTIVFKCYKISRGRTQRHTFVSTPQWTRRYFHLKHDKNYYLRLLTKQKPPSCGWQDAKLWSIFYMETESRQIQNRPRACPNLLSVYTLVCVSALLQAFTFTFTLADASLFSLYCKKCRRMRLIDFTS